MTFGPISKKKSLVKRTLTLNPIGKKDMDKVLLDELLSNKKSVHGQSMLPGCHFFLKPA